MNTQEADYILEIVSEHGDPEFCSESYLKPDETDAITDLIFDYKNHTLQNEQGEMDYTQECILEKIDELLALRTQKAAAAILTALHNEFRDLFFRKKAGDEIPHRELVLNLFFEPVEEARPRFTQAQADEQIGRSTYHIIRKLRKEGYVEREDTGKTKGPRYLYRLTPEGWDAINKHGIAGAGHPLTPEIPTREPVVKI